MEHAFGSKMLKKKHLLAFKTLNKNALRQYFSYSKTSLILLIQCGLLSCFLFFLHEALLFCFVIFSWYTAKTIKSLKCSLSLTLKTKNNQKKKLTALSPHGHGSMPHRPFCFLLYCYKASLTFRGKKKVCDVDSLFY